MSYPSGPPPMVEQHCYRHADRRAGVSCQRCDRPICPSCMVTASVGFQCPDCARQGASQQRLVDVHRHQSVPYLTYGLIAVNVAVFLLGVGTDRSIGGDYGSLNGRFGVYGPLIADGEWWRVVTGGFLHANLFHLAMNMYVLYLMGTSMEAGIGRIRFGVLYVVGLLGGSAGAIVMSPDALTVGASGAIFGLFGAMLCLELSFGRKPLQTSIGSTIALNLVITVVFSQFISVGGHLGGLVAGALGGAIMFGVSPVQAMARRDLAPAARNGLVAGVAGLGAVLFAVALVAASGSV